MKTRARAAAPSKRSRDWSDPDDVSAEEGSTILLAVLRELYGCVPDPKRNEQITLIRDRLIKPDQVHVVWEDHRKAIHLCPRSFDFLTSLSWDSTNEWLTALCVDNADFAPFVVVPRFGLLNVYYRVVCRSMGFKAQQNDCCQMSLTTIKQPADEQGVLCICHEETGVECNMVFVGIECGCLGSGLRLCSVHAHRSKLNPEEDCCPVCRCRPHHVRADREKHQRRDEEEREERRKKEELARQVAERWTIQLAERQQQRRKEKK